MPFCEICYDEFNDNEGIICINKHFICLNDINLYLTENILPQLHKLKKNKCLIKCPVINCLNNYNTIELYNRMNQNEKLRYISILYNIFELNINIKRLKNCFQDILILKCPTCKYSVDPLPDACSAVMCLNCGGYYCNYCFQGFSTGNTETDRSECHIHTAIHHPAEDPTRRDAFLPNDIVLIGQLEQQKKQLVECVALAMTSKEFAIDNRHEISVALILIHHELNDLKTTAYEIWNLAENNLIGKPTTTVENSIENTESKSDNNNNHNHNHNDHNNNNHDNNNNNEQQTQPTQGEQTEQNNNNNNNSNNNNNNNAIPSNNSGVLLANALKTQNTSAIRQILHAYHNNLDINYIEPTDLHNLLSLSILSRQKDVALHLIRKGVNPLAKSRNDRHALYYVAELGYLDLLIAIFEKYPTLDVNMIVASEPYHYTLIHTAARYNHGHIIEYLSTKEGIDVNAKEGEYGYTSIMMAVVLNNRWAIDTLLNVGADISIPARNGRTPLYVAVEKSQLSTFQTFLSVPSSSIKFDVNEPVCLTHGSRPLHVAIIYNKLEMVEYLIQSGANIDAADYHGTTPLLSAIIQKLSQIAITLLKHGANPNHVTNFGRTYLYPAIEKNLVDVVKMLYTDYNIPINTSTTTENITSYPLSVAIIYKSYDCLRLLIELGANIDQIEGPSEGCNTPLINAVCLEDYWATQYLLKHNANPLIPNSVGRLPLYVAAEKGCLEIIRLLLADPRVDINGIVSLTTRETALHVAVNWNQTNAITILLSLGANEFAENSNEKTPLDLATEKTTTSYLHIFQYYRRQRERINGINNPNNGDGINNNNNINNNINNNNNHEEDNNINNNDNDINNSDNDNNEEKS